MSTKRFFPGITVFGLAVFGATTLGSAVGAQQPAAGAQVTFAKDIAPILQRSCQNCHRPNGVAPMPLVTYEDVRPWARSIKTRTGLGRRAGVMPPWYIEQNVGIQHYKDDPSLSDEEVAKIAKWADSGAPLGNAADMPPARVWADDTTWRIGKPDLIVRMKDIVVKGNAPDWWGEVPSVPTGLTEDRYIAALEIKEVNDVKAAGDGRHTVGGRFVVHHMIWRTAVPNTEQQDPLAGFWPVHEVGRNPDFFDPDAGRMLKAGSEIVSDSVHLHSNGRDTTAHLEIGFKFHPKDYQPKLRPALVALGNGVDIDIKPMEAGQQLHAYAVLQEHTKIVTFEPHLHAPGMRMCLEAIWGINIETLTCAGYDHNWVRGYAYDDDHAPILPKGTILHIIGYMDNSPANKNIPDPRNWQGSGNRSVANMFIDLGMRVALTDEQFEAEMAARRAKLKLTRNDHVIGCPLCNVPTPPQARPANAQGQQP
jgi:mono/diheme cytochrome c family protein